MLRKFAEGLLFGAGFGISLMVVWYGAAWWVTPAVMNSQLGRMNSELESSIEKSVPAPTGAGKVVDEGPPFHELPVDDQIAAASVIVLAELERTPDGRLKAVVREFLRKQPNTTFYFDVGDEYPPASYFVEDGKDYPTQVVIFFTGSPARMAQSVSVYEKRIRALGDIPLELFRQKCRDTRSTNGDVYDRAT